MAYHPDAPASPVVDLQRLLDPRLEWVHDKPIGPGQNQALYNALGVVWRVMAGGITVRTARGAWQAGAGSWVILQPGHRYQGFSEGTRLWSIGYRFNRTRGSSWFAGADVVVIDDDRGLEAAGRRLIRSMELATGQAPLGGRQFADFTSRLGDWMQVEAAFRQLLAAVVAAIEGRGLDLMPTIHPDERIRTAMAVIKREPWSAGSEPASLARLLKVSRRRLEQLFASQIGHGVGEERARRRLEMACELLSRRDVQIKQVAGRCGFPRSSGFSAWFRRHAGVTPKRFRRGAQGDPS